MTETATYRTKMIEVGLPLEAINAASAREKSIRHGHPSTLHLYWARRPLAACRAVLFSSLVDDPSADPAYKDQGEEAIQERRQELHDLLAELVLWESSNDERIINRARAEIASSLASFDAEKGEINASDWPGVIERTAKPELVNRYLAEVAPPVLDPFAGGGTIPLEAQRLGLRALASDLNPVAVLINKALIETPKAIANCSGTVNTLPNVMSSRPRLAFSESIEKYGKRLIERAREICQVRFDAVRVTDQHASSSETAKSHAGDVLPLVATLYVRSVPSPDPSAHEHYVPLLPTNQLCSKGQPVSLWEAEGSRSPFSQLFISKGRRNAPEGYKDPTTKTGRGNFRCSITGAPITSSYLKEAAAAGQIRQHPYAMVLDGSTGKVYVPISPDFNTEPNDQDDPLPSRWSEMPTPPISGYFNPWVYSFKTIGSLFSHRQKHAISGLITAFEHIRQETRSDGLSNEYSDAVMLFLATAVARLPNYNNSFCTWHHGREGISHTFSEQGVKMCWDFAEANPFGERTGSLRSMLNYTKKSPSILTQNGIGTAQQGDATTQVFEHSGVAISTDPPYFSSLTYADFSDFFYGLHRELLGGQIPELYTTVATPKGDECVAAPHRHDGDRNAAAEHFVSVLSRSLEAASNQCDNSIPLTIFYAFKEQDIPQNTEAEKTGWETFLESVLSVGLRVTSTIPMRTEYTTTKKKFKNSLASSIVLACRPRAVDASITTRTDFVRQLRAHLGKALIDLQQSSIAPVDLQQASIGPGMAVFSKYAKVLENDGSEMSVRAALGLINQALEEVLSEQEGEFDADTRFATIWFEQFGFDTGVYGIAETLAKAKAISVDGVVESGILESTGGNVRLLKPEELDDDWTPEDDHRLTVWEVTHYLCRALETGGVDGAADLVRRVGGLADSARDLAYRLFSICDKKKWATEAQPYNALVASWPDIQNAAAQQPVANTTDEEKGLFEG